MATTYLTDVADCWYQGWSRSKGIGARWIDFAEELCVQFGERNIAYVIEEFNLNKRERSLSTRRNLRSWGH